MREELFKNGADLCIATMFVAAGTSDALLTAGTATTGLAALLIRLRQRHGPQCGRVQGQIKARLEAKYGALAEVPEFAGEFRRASDLMGGVVQQCLLPLDALARTAFDKEGFTAAAERALMDALPFDDHERSENRVSVQIVAEAVGAGLAAGRASPEFRAALADEVVLEMAREIGLLKKLAETARDEGRARGRRQEAHYAEFSKFIEEFRARPEGAIDTATRDTLNLVAQKFGDPDPEERSSADLRAFLIEKAKDYRRLEAQVRALGDREGRIANLKAAAEAAVGALRLDEAKALIRDAINVQRTERTLQALRDDAALVETEAGIALLENDADEAYRLLSGAAEAFVPFDAGEAFHRRRDYLQRLYWHGLRYGGSGLARAVEVGLLNARALDEAEDAYSWATAQTDLGIALEEQGARVGGEAGGRLIGEAVAAHRAALRVYTEAAHPLAWATTQNNLGAALLAQGERVGGEKGAELFSGAVAACRAALRVRTEAVHPVEWAATKTNLGNALRAQGAQVGGEAGAALIGEAVAAYRAALRVYTEAAHPVNWATTQNNLGVALSDLGARVGGELGAAMFGEAVAAHRAALRVRTEAAHPVDWATTQNNLGNALAAQGAQVGGEAGAALIGEAVAAFRAALRVRTEAAQPVDWAMTTENLGLAHEALADAGPDRQREAALVEAERCLATAVGRFDPEHMPYNHAKSARGLARVRGRLAGLRGDSA